MNKLLYAALFLSISAAFSCKPKTEQSNSSHIEASSPSENTETKSGKTVSCAGVGKFSFSLKNYDGIRGAFGEGNVSEIQEDPMEGLYATVKDGGEEFKVYFDDDKNILSFSVYDGSFATAKGIKSKMSLEEIEKALGGKFTCNFSDEVGMLSFDVPDSEGCVVAILQTKTQGKHISDLLPLSLKKQGKFQTDAPELVKAEPYIFELRVLSPMVTGRR